MLLIPAGNPSAWTGMTGNNTYLIQGRVPALIDAGVGRPQHLDAVAGALAGAPLALVLLTHGHSDHSAGVPALLERWPAARIRRHSDGTLADGERISAGDGFLRAIYTPGHAPDHFCFFDEERGDLFCGDLARAGGSIVIPASQGGRLRDYLDSLAAVQRLDPRRLLPGHGPIVDTPATVLADYLAHRAEREAQIVAALDAGRTTPEGIVTAVYGELPRQLAAAAADSVLAHLVKLAEEGRAQDAGGSWRLSGMSSGS